MRAKFQIERPADVEASMTLTMTIREWEQLRAQLSDAWPTWDLSRSINDLVRAATKHFNVDTQNLPAPELAPALPEHSAKAARTEPWKCSFDGCKIKEAHGHPQSQGPQPGDLDYPDSERTSGAADGTS